MRCISKFLSLAVCVLASASLLIGCGSINMPSGSMSYSENSVYSNYSFLVSESGAAKVADPFAWNLCIPDPNQEDDPLLDTMNEDCSAGLFDLNNKEIIYARDINARVYPASLTKIMTALVALENMPLDTELVASGNVVISDPDAQVAGLEPGDTMTLNQALHLLLIYSANDVAVMIAENVGGDTTHFIDMMNAKAQELGATNTNFINSNGLSDQNHYTTVYDLYLIFNKAMEYNEFQEIISTGTYTTVYQRADGTDKEVTVDSTDHYLIAETKAPSGVNVVGGKTGTTTAAGHCLMILCRDTAGNPYIACVMKARTEDELYQDMNQLLRYVIVRKS